MTKTTGVIFDMDGLMFDTENLYYEVAQETANQMHLPYSRDFYLSILGTSEQYGYDATLELFKDKKAVEDFLIRAGKFFHQRIQKGAPAKKGLFELVQTLEDKNIAMIVASSNNRLAINHQLVQAGLDKKLTNIISADDVAHAKPNPEIFIRANQIIGTPKASTLVLEDSQHGIQAAFSAGIPSIMVPDMLPPEEELRQKTLAVMPDLLAVRDYILAE